MTEDEEKDLEQINAKLEEEHKKYAIQCAEICRQPGFDMNKRKWKKKLEEASKEFAKRYVELHMIRESITGEEYNPIRDFEEAEAAQQSDPRDWFRGSKG